MTSRFATLSARALIAGLLVSGIAASVHAQTTESPPAATSEQFSEDKLESFVAASERVNEIGQKWQPQIQGAENEEAATNLRSQANAEMASAVQAEGLSPQEYREIYQAAMADPQLNSRLAEIYKQSKSQ